MQDQQEKIQSKISTKATFNIKRTKSLANKMTRTSSFSHRTNETLSKGINFLTKTNPKRQRIYSLTALKKIQCVVNPQLSSRAYCVMYAQNNQIILSQNSTITRQIASLTKLMTAFTVVNICSRYGIHVKHNIIPIHHEAAMMEGTSANLLYGDELSIQDLLYGLLLPSGNDAAIALAQHFGKYVSFNTKSNSLALIKGERNLMMFKEEEKYYDLQYQKESIDMFVFEMNNFCKKIGLKKTKFSNPTGLNNENNYSTPYDLAILTSFCLKNYTLRKIMKKKIYKCKVKNDKMGTHRQIQWKNTNKHLFEIKDCIGGKTGITTSAGPCLSSVYRIRGRQVILILLKSFSMDERYVDAKNVYEWLKWKKLQQE